MTDITYVATAAGWVYLAVVVDLFSRKAIGLVDRRFAGNDVGERGAARDAVERRRPDGKRLLHHSDRGCQYTSDAYQKILRALGIECSMSRRAAIVTTTR